MPESTFDLLKDVVLHLDAHLAAWTVTLGPWIYVLLFAIIFCETGLVITPFLPGDSLLFAVGAVAAIPGSAIHPGLIMFLLCVAAVLGDAVNYIIGREFAHKLLESRLGRYVDRRHLERAEQFYAKHGGKAIVLARFVPIIRTFAPFVAGIARMEYSRFATFNIAGGITWVVLFVGAGYLFGSNPLVKDRFHIVIIAIIILSLVPVVVEMWRARREAAADRLAGRG